MMEGSLKINELRQEAGRVARIRGHSLGKWEQLSAVHDPHIILEATCWICDASVTIDNRPAQDGDGMSGVAIAVNCSED